ncbi:MAG TPA: ExsB family protein [Atribacterota bacterium]|nr:ExsB family protein [Atribacterota bacterium]
MHYIALEVERIINSIRRIVPEERITVAFSGGLDSTVVLFLAKEALGRERVKAANVDFGLFTYERARQNVRITSTEMQVKLHSISGKLEQTILMKGGPDCNLCTRKIKLGLIRAYTGEQIVFTGSNQSDSWGSYGTAFSDGFYAPLFHYSKEEIKIMANYLNLKIRYIGENTHREGCKLKHLLKPLANISYHGQAVSQANEILLQQIKELNLSTSIANVKIIGPLNRNIALINIFPIPARHYWKKLTDKIGSIAYIEDCFLIHKPLELTIKANKGLFNNLRSRYWIEQGRLQPEFAVPLRFNWLLTTNHRLKTFQVIAYN